MAGRLAAVPEETTDDSPAANPPSNLYRDSIRSVALPRGQYIRSTLFAHSGGQSGSSFSVASSYYPSNDSGCSSGWASAAAAADSGTMDLTRIAHRMVSDGYTQRMVQAFEDGGDPDRVLGAWFFELDVDWVLQLQPREEHGLRGQLQDMSASSLQDLVGRWIRALTVIVFNVFNLVVAAVNKMPPVAVAQFGKASVSAMLVFVDAILAAPKAEELRAVVDMFICVSSVSYYMSTTLICTEAKSIFSDIGCSLEGEGNMLIEAICNMMEEVRTLIEDDESWAVDILRGRGEVHRNTRLMVDCILCIKMTCRTSAQRHDAGNLPGLVDNSVAYLKYVLLRKSELCSDLSLRYLFLLNNSYFIAQVSEPSGDNHGLQLIPECEQYMNSYLDASWGHVLPFIPKSYFPGLLCCCINVSSQAKFESAFHQTYTAQKFWKVPDPQLRDALRVAITKRVIPGYHNYLNYLDYNNYLNKHPKLWKLRGPERNSLDVLNMLRHIFEG